MPASMSLAAMTSTTTMAVGGGSGRRWGSKVNELQQGKQESGVY